MRGRYGRVVRRSDRGDQCGEFAGEPAAGRLDRVERIDDCAVDRLGEFQRRSARFEQLIGVEGRVEIVVEEPSGGGVAILRFELGAGELGRVGAEDVVQQYRPGVGSRSRFARSSSVISLRASGDPSPSRLAIELRVRWGPGEAEQPRTAGQRSGTAPGRTRTGRFGPRCATRRCPRCPGGSLVAQVVDQVPQVYRGPAPRPQRRPDANGRCPERRPARCRVGGGVDPVADQPTQQRRCVLRGQHVQRHRVAPSTETRPGRLSRLVTSTVHSGLPGISGRTCSAVSALSSRTSTRRPDTGCGSGRLAPDRSTGNSLWSGPNARSKPASASAGSTGSFEPKPRRST